MPWLHSGMVRELSCGTTGLRQHLEHELGDRPVSFEVFSEYRPGCRGPLRRGWRAAALRSTSGISSCSVGRSRPVG
jgi:hypothetical protein